MNASASAGDGKGSEDFHAARTPRKGGRRLEKGVDDHEKQEKSFPQDPEIDDQARKERARKRHR